MAEQIFTDPNSDEEDMFSAIDGATVEGQRLPFLEEGMFTLEIHRVAAIKTRERRMFYLVESLILTSTNENRPVGMKVTWMTDMAKDMGPINVKRFMGAAFGMVDPKEIDVEITSDLTRMSVSAEQPLKFVQVFATVTKIITKKEKKDFHEHRFEPVAGGDYFSIQVQLEQMTPEQRAQLDASAEA